MILCCTEKKDAQELFLQIKLDIYSGCSSCQEILIFE